MGFWKQDNAHATVKDTLDKKKDADNNPLYNELHTKDMATLIVSYSAKMEAVVETADLKEIFKGDELHSPIKQLVVDCESKSLSEKESKKVIGMVAKVAAILLAKKAQGWFTNDEANIRNFEKQVLDLCSEDSAPGALVPPVADGAPAEDEDNPKKPSLFARFFAVLRAGLLDLLNKIKAGEKIDQPDAEDDDPEYDDPEFGLGDDDESDKLLPQIKPKVV